MWEVIYPVGYGPQPVCRGGLDFVPGQIKVYNTREDIPDDIQNEPAFVIREVEYGEDRIEHKLRHRVMEKPVLGHLGKPATPKKPEKVKRINRPDRTKKMPEPAPPEKDEG